MSATARRLEIDEIADHLDQIRAGMIDRIHRAYPKVALEDLQDAYGDLSEEALTTAFGAVEQLEAWVQQALRRDAIDILRSARIRRDTLLDPDDDTILVLAEPDGELAGGEARGLLHEFLAGLSEQDRLIAYLHLDPEWDWKPERIATATGIPVREVRLSVDRNGGRLRRFVVANLAGKRCASLTREKLAWIDSGELSLHFKLHLRRCAACRAELRDGRQAVRHALLPLLPPASIPLAAGGLLSHAHNTVVTHPATIRAQEGVYRWRKVVPVGGGGSAAVAAKLAAAGAVVTVTAALHVVDHPHPRPHAVHPRVHIHHRAAHEPAIHHLPIHKLTIYPATVPVAPPVAAPPVRHHSVTHRKPARNSTHEKPTITSTDAKPASSGIQETATKPSATYNPPPLANPLRASSRRHGSDIERTASSSENTSTSSTQSSQRTQTDSYAPAPVQSAPAVHKSSQSSSSVPGPGGPPAP